MALPARKLPVETALLAIAHVEEQRQGPPSRRRSRCAVSAAARFLGGDELVVHLVSGSSSVRMKEGFGCAIGTT
jgi:hypothetical protein